ncbi:UNVERIFIED_CONTAM: hypothetical protein Sangu_2126100 [Sesamum angustifolium]|uniref:Retrotransposon gag domain-containing protein n=1 Tax=Sesamum angustifolium TaxID=2727405 RepID=A0AAW2LDW8_9LAMI
MQTRSRAREVPEMDDAPEPQLNGADQETMIQLTQEALLALIHDASTRALPKPWLSLRRNTPSIRPLLHLVEVENYPRLPRRRSRAGGAPSPPLFLAEALPAGVKVSNLSEYDGTGDPQEHLDKFYAKIDWYDLSDAAYCKVFRTTLSKRALAWFNQLPAGTISSLEQLTQRFLHHFSMNKRFQKRQLSYLPYVKGERTAERLHAKVHRGGARGAPYQP